LEEILRRLWAEYSPNNQSEKWKIVEGSTIKKRRWWDLENIRNLVKYLGLRVKLGKYPKNYMMIGWIVINITNESSYACNKLIGRMYKWKPQWNKWNKLEILPFKKHHDTWLKTDNEIVKRNEEIRVDEYMMYLKQNVRFHQQ
jgi:hypothetical protein